MLHERGKFIMIWHLHTHTPSFSHVRGARLRPWNYLKGHHIQTPTYKMPWPCPISQRYVPSIWYSWGFYVLFFFFLAKMAKIWNHFITLSLNFTRLSTLTALSHLSFTYLMPSFLIFFFKKQKLSCWWERESSTWLEIGPSTLITRMIWALRTLTWYQGRTMVQWPCHAVTTRLHLLHYY